MIQLTEVIYVSLHSSKNDGKEISCKGYKRFPLPFDTDTWAEGDHYFMLRKNAVFGPFKEEVEVDVIGLCFSSEIGKLDVFEALEITSHSRLSLLSTATIYSHMIQVSKSCLTVMLKMRNR